MNSEFGMDNGDGEVELDLSFNEFTGGARESILPPEPHEPICLISYEITWILLGDGPHARKSFWKMYRRELELQKTTNYRNYHINLCQHHLTTLDMKLDRPIYFRDGKLSVPEQTDLATNLKLADSRFSNVSPKEY